MSRIRSGQGRFDPHPALVNGIFVGAARCTPKLPSFGRAIYHKPMTRTGLYISKSGINRNPRRLLL